MRYKIEITRIDVEKYQPIDAWVQGAGKKKEGNEHAFGYVTPPRSTREVERVVLLQETDNLDVQAVIKAVNGL